jgi:CrcB protein
MTVIAVLLGGALGTALRLVVDVALPHEDTGFPLGTLLVNVAGSFALGALVARLWPVAPPWLRAGLGAGLLGSFTTFSAVALSAVTLSAAGLAPVAIGYVTASLIGGLGAALLGLRLGGRPQPIGPDE